MNRFIQWSSFKAIAQILFWKKTDRGLQLCVDYRALNLCTVMIRYPLPRISELLDWVRKARIFNKLDLRNTYHLIRITDGDEFKTVLRTCNCQLEYGVMLLILTNAPAIFQAYIDECQRPHIDNVTMCYLDDIHI